MIFYNFFTFEVDIGNNINPLPVLKFKEKDGNEILIQQNDYYCCIMTKYSNKSFYNVLFLGNDVEWVIFEIKPLDDNRNEFDKKGILSIM